jgi:hypothetical protein
VQRLWRESEGTFSLFLYLRMRVAVTVLLRWGILFTLWPNRSAASRLACGIAALTALAGDEGRPVMMLICMPMGASSGMTGVGGVSPAVSYVAHVQVENGPTDSDVGRRRPGEIRSGPS